MSPEWVGVIISGVSLLVSIAGIWIQTWLTLRTGSTGTQSTAPSATSFAPPPEVPSAPPPIGIPPYGVPRSRAGAPPLRHDSLPMALKNLTAATFVVPLVPLAYAMANLRVETATFGMVPAAVVALLFVLAVVPLRILVRRRNQTAMRVAEVLSRVFAAATGIGGIVFAYMTVVGVLHAVGINWPPGEFVNPGLFAFLAGVLAALSGFAYFLTSSSATLLRIVREDAGRS
jgi:hypothetical protein